MKKLAAIIAIVVALLFFGCTGAQKAPTPVEQTPVVVPPAPVAAENNTIEKPLPCQGLANVLETDSCFAKLANANSDVSMCDRIYSIEKRDECMMPFALKNEKLCEKLVNADSAQNCYEAAARRLNDTNYCVKIGDTDRKNKCLKDLSPPCSFEQSDSATKLCLALVHNDTSYCNSNQCLFELGVQNSNLGSCAMISDAERALRGACRAIAKQDSTACKETGISLIEDYCYQLAAYRINNSVWCTYAASGSPYRNNCLKHFAIENNDTTLCLYAEPEVERDYCYMNYSISTGNAGACEKVINSLLQVECYLKTALAASDMTACNPLYYATRKTCYNIIITSPAPIYGGSASCANIMDTDPWQYKCYSKVAKDSKNQSICDLINNTKYQTDCYFQFS